MYLYVALGRMCFWPRPIKFLMWFIAVWFKASHAAKSSEGFVLLLFTVEKMAVRKLATSGQLLQYHTIHKYSATLKVWSQPSEANVPVRNWARVRARAFIFSSVLLCFLLSVSSCLQTGRNGSDTFSVSSTQAQLRDFMYVLSYLFCLRHRPLPRHWRKVFWPRFPIKLWIITMEKASSPNACQTLNLPGLSVPEQRTAIEDLWRLGRVGSFFKGLRQLHW